MGGVARHVLDALETGIPGWRGVLLCPPGPLSEAAKTAGIAVVTGPVSPADGIRSAVAEIRRTVSKLRPAVVHSHLSYADVTVGLATASLPVRRVTTEHGIAGEDLVYHGTAWRSKVREFAHSARLRQTDALIAVTQSTLDVVRTKWRPPARLSMTVILNGVDPLTHQPPARKPGLHVVSLARLAPEKGLDDLVRAFALLVGEHPEAHLTLAGEGPLEGELEALVRKLGLDAHIDLPGHVDAPDLLSKADVLAQLSIWENCSYSILDAQVHGLGVVATPVGGNSELLPERCLVGRRDHAEVARLMVHQGYDPHARPVLPEGWPTILAMCESIGRVYRGFTQ
jgi:glycosyltransferase involved in cell wall biosynthesis